MLLELNVLPQYIAQQVLQGDKIDIINLKTTEPNQLYTSIVVMIELQCWGLLKARKDPEQGRKLHEWYENNVKTMFENRVLMVD